MDTKSLSFYRAMEILPGFLIWLTFILMFALSFIYPGFIAFFVILFDIYWFFKTLYLFFYLRASFKKLKSNLKIDWLNKLKSEEKTKYSWEKIYHLVIMPMYKEPMEVVRETLNTLKDCNYPKDKLIVVLSTEERAGGFADEIVNLSQKEFGGYFFRFLATKHPQDMPGEMPGKSSNETWAIKEAKRLIIDEFGINYDDIIVSAFDVDSQVFKEYFGVLAFNFLTAKNPLRSSYQPIPFFFNNFYQSPSLARIMGFSTTFWNMTLQSNPEKMQTFSSHSMPFSALVDVGFWQKDIVSEDSRIFWQCYMHYKGDWKVVPLFYPVSMDVNSAPSFLTTMKYIYKQQRRWAWGSENIAYIISNFRKIKEISLFKKISWTFNVVEGFHSWGTNAFIIFLLGWLPIIFGGDHFKITILAYNLPQITSIIMTASSIGIVTSMILSLILLPPRPSNFRWYHYAFFLIQWILMPLTLVLFSAIPAIDAQTRLALSGKFRLDFWVTPKHRNK